MCSLFKGACIFKRNCREVVKLVANIYQITTKYFKDPDHQNKGDESQERYKKGK